MSLCGQALPAAFFNPSVGGGPWGELPTQRRALSPVLWILFELLPMTVLVLLAVATAGNRAVFWLLVLPLFIATIPVGIWLERRTIRGEKRP